jgi:hypothetical protein
MEYGVDEMTDNRLPDENKALLETPEIPEEKLEEVSGGIGRPIRTYEMVICAKCGTRYDRLDSNGHTLPCPCGSRETVTNTRLFL